MTGSTLPATVLDRPRRTITLFLAIASAVVVASAWAFELAGYPPCTLCLAQRNPYYAVVLIALLAHLIERGGRWTWISRLLLLVAAGLFLWGGSIGVYQAGAEWGFWPGPTDCTATRGAQIPTAASDLLGSLAKVKIPDCSVAQLRILGLSFAGWNVLVSAGLATIAVAAALLPNRRSAE